MRSSRPIPRATSATSAPSSSETLAISLMNEILVARKALEASLIISALATSVLMTSRAERRVQSASTRSAYSTELVVGADHHAVGLHEVLDRAALLEELGVGDVAEAVAAALDRAAGARPARCSSSRARADPSRRAPSITASTRERSASPE